jgi:glyoxylase-like metal-dependent hydrolase (beta-lactamase superfamily II)
MVHVLDTFHLGRAGIIAATALETNDGVLLFDVGAESTFSILLSELNKRGFAPHDVRHALLSHIHFDHAGAAWRFAESGTTIYVHPRGAPHLLDPAKLVASATRLFGDEMERLWGKFAPVPAERLRVLEDGDSVHIGEINVRAIATPGHASHHHVYHWEGNVFGGDVAGVRLGSGPPIPPFVPPELNIEQWRQSIAKIRALNPARLFLPHFGLISERIEWHLDALDERVVRWSEWFRQRLRDGANETQLTSEFAEYEAADLRRGGARAEDVHDYEHADPSYMAVPASERYWRKVHPEAVTLDVKS